MEEKTAYIAMGSNVGEKAATLLTAAKMIDETRGVDVLRISSMIETEPVGGPEDQPDYLNAAVKVRTTLDPWELLEVLQEIESHLGRNRSNEQRWGPRTCDLDILMMEDVVMDSNELTLPHPRMHERLFVLRPLAMIGGEAVHPTLNKTVAQLLGELEASR